MIPAAFAYSRPTSLDEAIGVLVEHPDAKILAGGQSLLPLMKLRLARPERLVDIGRLPELRGIRRLGDGRMAVGALTTYREVLDSPLVHYGLLRDAVPHIGDVQVRNVGTVGGAIAHADPASDLPACLLALEAEIVARSVRGERRIAATEFFLGPFETALEPDEILTEIVLPAPRGDASSAYASLEQPASGYSIVGVAAVVFVADGDAIAGARVAVTGVSDVAYRATAVEAALVGQPTRGGDVAAAAGHATDGRQVGADIHVDHAYRTAVAKVYTRRAIEAALDRIR